MDGHEQRAEALHALDHEIRADERRKIVYWLAMARRNPPPGAHPDWKFALDYVIEGLKT